jgi:hypothetical protein
MRRFVPLLSLLAVSCNTPEEVRSSQPIAVYTLLADPSVVASCLHDELALRARGPIDVNRTDRPDLRVTRIFAHVPTPRFLYELTVRGSGDGSIVEYRTAYAILTGQPELSDDVEAALAACGVTNRKTAEG